MRPRTELVGEFTHFKFPKDDQYPNPHDYYDIGAMRIPEIDAMKSSVRNSPPWGKRLTLLIGQ